MKPRIAVIGLGGMGVRHVAALKQAGADLIAACDVRKEVTEKFQSEHPGCKVYNDYHALLKEMGSHLDLLSVVTNTPSRADICRIAMASGVKRILTEKPFTTCLKDAYELTEMAKTHSVKLGVNTYRYVSPNHLRLRELLRSGALGKLRHIAIQSASAGLGNMGSVFFAVMNFFAESEVETVTGYIDKTGTPSARGPEFKDPGGFGMVLYQNGVRAFIDSSEDTGVPYTFHLVTTHGRIFIDELFNKWSVFSRSEADKAAPLHHYFKPLEPVPFELSHSWDVVHLTAKAMEAMLSPKPIEFTAEEATKVMEMITAMYVSEKEGHRPVRLPLEKTHHTLEMPFA